jgi:hypothetical protein
MPENEGRFGGSPKFNQLFFAYQDAKAFFEREQEAFLQAQERINMAQRLVELSRGEVIRAASGHPELALLLPWSTLYRDGDRWQMYAGAYIPTAVREMMELVEITGTPVEIAANGGMLRVEPGDEISEIQERYRKSGGVATFSF